MGDDEQGFEALVKRARGGEPKATRRRCSSRDAQVCRQIRDRLDLVVSGELDDPVLEGLFVLEVLPVGDMSSVCVRLGVPAGACLPKVHARLCALGGRLRCEAAAAIHRKRTPTLRFELVPTDE